MHVRLSESGLASLRGATAENNTLSKLTKVICIGWPDLKHNVPLPIRAFWPYRDKLVVDGKIILKGTKVVVPKALQSLTLQRIHTSHQGPEACVR